MVWTTRTIGLSLAGVALVGGLAYVAFREDPVPVDLVTVARAPLNVTIDADGQTRIRNLYEVASPIAGTARRAPVAVGDRVVADETLVALVEPVSPALLDARTRAQAEASWPRPAPRSTSRAPTCAAPRRRRPSPGCNSTGRRPSWNAAWRR
jgi:HlyD family secretion protein